MSGKLARPERFELPTYSSGGCRSIQLSYGRAVVMQVYIVGRHASMVADGRAFDARLFRCPALKSVRENWAALRELIQHFGTPPGVAPRGCT